MCYIKNSLLLLILSVIPGITVPYSLCPRVSFKYFCEKQDENGTEIFTECENYFPETLVNDFAMMEDICVNKTGLPIVRHCLGHNQWEELGKVSCQTDLPSNELSKNLNEIQLQLNENVDFRASFGTSGKNAVNKTFSIIKKLDNKIQPVDVVNVNKIVKSVLQDSTNLNMPNEITALYNQLMSTNKSVLELSARLNTTNDLLYNFEDYMNQVTTNLGPLKNCNKQESFHLSDKVLDSKERKGVMIIIENNLSIFYLYPDCNQYTGIAIYDSPAADRINCMHLRYWYRLLYANQSLSDLKSEPGLQTASFLTDPIWTALKESGAQYLIFKIYANNAFFIETNAQKHKANTKSLVLSISIPQVSHILPHQLVFLLRKEEEVNIQGFPTHSYCGYWDYGTWKSDGITRSMDDSIDDPIVVCYTNHLTQFAFLVGGSLKQQNIMTGYFDQKNAQNSRDESMLDDVTASGCGLSLFGLLGIWLTAALSKKWRSVHTTKLLLNFSLALMLLFDLLLLIYINEWIWQYEFRQNNVSCIALGALLQYSVLWIFSWMLLIGYLQYQRHITVFVVRSQHLVRRVATIALIMPLLPTLLLLLIDSSSYSPVHYEDGIASLCYPSGYGLAFGVLLPLGLMLTVNIYIFIRILYRISQLENQNRRLIWSQLRLFVLLFFLLGLSWFFGICSYFRLGVAVNFLFCITATIQGFVLFVYFVLFDKVASSVWVQLLIGNQQTESVTYELDN